MVPNRCQPQTAVGGVIDLHHEPDRDPGSWAWRRHGQHIAFNVETDDALAAQRRGRRARLSPTLGDQGRFTHSMYVRSPGGILVECTANVPGGFYQDEAPEELGTRLLLPPWYEEQRDAIVSQLEPITVPEENRPKPGTVSARPAVAAEHAPAGESTVPLARYKGTFDATSRRRKSSIWAGAEERSQSVESDCSGL